jgi:hypothetical protein
VITFREVSDKANRIMDQHEQLSKLPDDIRKAIERYDNPRGLPENWIVAYLGRDKAQLALDVMRAFDHSHAVQKSCRRWILALTVSSSVLLKVAELALTHYFAK